MNEWLSAFHILGFAFWIAGLSGYALIRIEEGERDAVLKQLIQRRKFDLMAIGGFFILFATGMAMIVTYGYIGTGYLPTWMAIKFLFLLLTFLVGLAIVGMDFAWVRKIREMRKYDIESVQKESGKLPVIIPKLTWIAIILTVITFMVAAIRF